MKPRYKTSAEVLRDFGYAFTVRRGEWADAHGGRDMSLEDWLREHSSFPLDTWKFYLGIEGD